MHTQLEELAASQGEVSAHIVHIEDAVMAGLARAEQVYLAQSQALAALLSQNHDAVMEGQQHLEQNFNQRFGSLEQNMEAYAHRLQDWLENKLLQSPAARLRMAPGSAGRNTPKG